MTQTDARVCPKCLSFMEVDYAHGPSCSGCDFTGEPVDVPFDPDRPMEEFRMRRDGLVALERFKLAQIEREDDFRLAAQRWYENLSVADRFWEDSRRKRVRNEELARMKPMARTMAMMMDGWRDGLLSSLYGRDTPLLALLNGEGPNRGNLLDEWLSEDGPILQVTEALGLA